MGLPRAQLELLETLPRPPTLPLLRPTAISPLTSVRRPSSPSLPTRSSQTSLLRTTAPRVFRSRRPGPTSQLTLDALEDEDVKTLFYFPDLRALVPMTVNPE